MLGGFSQGAALSLYTFYQSDFKMAGCMALSGYVPLLPVFGPMMTSTNKTQPLLMCHGQEDQVVRYSWGQKSFQTLKDNNIVGDFLTFPYMGHSSSEEEIVEMIKETADDVDGVLNIDRIIEARPWLSLIRDFKKVLWSDDVDKMPHIVAIHTAAECSRMVSILPTLFQQELGIEELKSSVLLGKMAGGGDQRCVIGFDTEGNPSVDTIQLSTKTVSAVIYIGKIGEYPKELAAFLESKAVVKAGVSVTDDFDAIKNTKYKGVSCKPSTALDVSVAAAYNGITKNYLSLDILSIDLLSIPKQQSVYIDGDASRRDKLDRLMHMDDYHRYCGVDAWLGFSLAHVLYQFLGQNKQIGFYEWTQSQLTGNFRSTNLGVKPAAESKSSSSSSSSSKFFSVGRSQKTALPSSGSSKFSTVGRSSELNNNNASADVAPVLYRTKVYHDAAKKETADSHFYLQKLQHINSGQKRPAL
eukprot:gene12236-14333_t